MDIVFIIGAILLLSMVPAVSAHNWSYPSYWTTTSLNYATPADVPKEAWIYEPQLTCNKGSFGSAHTYWWSYGYSSTATSWYRSSGTNSGWYFPASDACDYLESGMYWKVNSGDGRFTYLYYNSSGNDLTLPIVDFNGDPVSGEAQLTVLFTDYSLNFPTTRNWSFGDGTYSTQQNPSHTYTAAGTYDVSLTATNLAGSDVKTKTGYITVTTSKPSANFIASPRNGTAPLNVSFTDTSTGSPTSWSWSFGDGETSTEQNPSHTYTTEGTYDVSLTVTNSGGSDTETKAGYVVVTVPEVWTFSITNTATRTAASAPNGQLMDTAIDNCNNMKSRLESKGWQQIFYRSGSEVTKADFNVNPESGHHTLNDAVLHFHVGHGTQAGSDGHTTLQLLNQHNNDNSLNASEVAGRWGGNNKWVILDSCYALSDDDWGKALGTSHGILGFRTQADVHPRFTERFFYYAIDENKTVYESFARTVHDLFENTKVPKTAGGDRMDNETMVAAVIFNDYNQAKYDYLPGSGTGIYSEPISDNLYRYSWLCNQTWRGV